LEYLILVLIFDFSTLLLASLVTVTFLSELNSSYYLSFSTTELIIFEHLFVDSFLSWFRELVSIWEGKLLNVTLFSDGLTFRLACELYYASSFCPIVES
jgi:hypothetical protein